MQKQRMHVTLSAELRAMIRAAATDAGFESENRWCVNAFQNQLKFDPHALQEFEQRLVDELDRIHTVEQTLLAHIDAFVRLFLMCIPDPVPGETQASLRLADRLKRYQARVLKNLSENGDAAPKTMTTGTQDGD